MSVSFDPNRNPYYQTIPEEPSNETEELAGQEEETLSNQEKLLGGWGGDPGASNSRPYHECDPTPLYHIPRASEKVSCDDCIKTCCTLL